VRRDSLVSRRQRAVAVLAVGALCGVAGCGGSPQVSSPTPVASAAPLSASPSPALTAVSHARPHRTVNSPVSVSFVSASTGWALVQKSCRRDVCTAGLLRTRNGGRTWRPIPIPNEIAVRGISRGAAIDTVHFINRRDGWLYGGDVWFTHDGGHRWSPARIVPFRIRGHVVADATAESLAVHGSTVFLVGSGCNTAGGMCQFGRLYRASVAGERFRAVPRLPQFGTGGGFFDGAVTVANGTVYLQEANNPVGDRLFADTSSGWARRFDPCAMDSAVLGYLDAAGPNALLDVCSGFDGTHGYSERAYLSVNDGVSWSRLAGPPAGGVVTAVAVLSARSFLVATQRGRVDISHDGGLHWTATFLRTRQRRDWLQVDFVSSRVGFAVPLALRSTLLRTRDGGRTWHVFRLVGGGAE
jgi:photosystem II stability/assembly factor-like uncharacterized protein